MSVIPMHGSENETKVLLKTNICVWVIYAKESFELHMKHQLSMCSNITTKFIRLEDFSGDGITGLLLPELLFIQSESDWAQKLTALHASDSHLFEKGASLIVFGDENDNLALKTSLKIGASDFLPDNSPLESFKDILLETSTETATNMHLGELLLFFNTKGGSGASTIALNTAAELAKNKSNKVLLLDLDVNFGVLADYLDVSPKYGIPDILDSINEIDELSLNSLVKKHSSGVNFLNFVQLQPLENQKLTQKLNQVIPALQSYYSHIVIDLSRGIESNYGFMVPIGSHVYFVTQQNLAALRNTNTLLNVFQFEYGLNKNNVEIIVNRYDKNSDIKLSDIEDSFPDLRVHVFQNEFKTVNEALNLGKPFVLHKKNSTVSKATSRLVNSICDDDKETEKSGWLNKLFR
ncbi:hypothetical protein FCV87_12040 [Vibrio breoganii]|uniref:AAA family ATPase n=1 Tax=Vibrio breoganii TaxID=553239 RepID=UPI000C84FF80|nr:AAA family ATPase [Vibrio breoganii]PMK32526.1 hypothetical protein BCU03_04805 [Vibrio breoganii]TKG27173.1 hypothetical protein FCV87_12040 [Vibrio breoganii]